MLVIRDPKNDIPKIRRLLLISRFSELGLNEKIDFVTLSSKSGKLTSTFVQCCAYPRYGEQDRYFDWNQLHWHFYFVEENRDPLKDLVPKLIDIALYDICILNSIKVNKHLSSFRNDVERKQQLENASTKTANIVKETKKLYKKVNTMIMYWFDLYINGNSKKDLANIIYTYYEPINFEKDRGFKGFPV